MHFDNKLFPTIFEYGELTMPDLAANMVQPVGGFPMHNMMMRYSLFIPKLYNWCKTLGFEPGKIMPSRAFCSDESQGYPIIMMAKHFGAFPFNHGRVGGMVATDRHGPHASHGQDMVIIQASHVGYDPESKSFGTYRRLQTSDQSCGPSCGKIFHVIEWYQEEYEFACKNILLQKIDGQDCIVIDNRLLRDDRDDGLLLRLEKLIASDNSGERAPLQSLSTSRVFLAAKSLVDKIGKSVFSEQATKISRHLTADLFYFRHNIKPLEEGTHHLEHSLIRYMPQIITSDFPTLTAAQIYTQVEFDLTFRSIVKEQSYKGKKLLFVAGLNIDISPQPGQLFPLTKFVPWAAYLQNPDGSSHTYEQQELFESLEQQDTDNPDQINLEDAIQMMASVKEIRIDIK